MNQAVASGRAHGKVILFGEHAVVHGVPALVCGIARGLYAEALPLPAGPSRLKLLQRDTDVASKEEMARALTALLALPPEAPPLALTVAGDLPPSVGLGFSASAAVALARAVEAHLAGTGEGRSDGAAAKVDEAQLERRVAQRANAWEGVFHGNPSGVDVAAAMHSGCLRYVRGQPPQPIAMAGELRLVVGLTGIRSSTREMVAGVARYIQAHPADGAARLRAIGELVAEGRLHIETGNLKALGRLLDDNQRQLAVLGVSCNSIETLCGLARKAGALGAKLTGAGGGGSVIALAEDAPAAARVKKIWQEAGYQAFTTHVRPVDSDPAYHAAKNQTSANLSNDS